MTLQTIDDATLDATLRGQGLPGETLRGMTAEKPILLVFLRHYG